MQSATRPSQRECGWLPPSSTLHWTSRSPAPRPTRVPMRADSRPPAPLPMPTTPSAPTPATPADPTPASSLSGCAPARCRCQPGHHFRQLHSGPEPGTDRSEQRAGALRLAAPSAHTVHLPSAAWLRSSTTPEATYRTPDTATLRHDNQFRQHEMRDSAPMQNGALPRSRYGSTGRPAMHGARADDPPYR